VSAVFDSDDDAMTVDEQSMVSSAVTTSEEVSSQATVEADLVAAKIKTRAERIADKYEKDCAERGVEVGFSSIILGELFGLAVREGLKCLKVEHSAEPQSVKAKVAEMNEKDKARLLRSYAVRIRKATRHEAHRDKGLTKDQRKERVVGSYYKCEAMAQACLDDLFSCDDAECSEFCMAVMPSV
jgi:hypothetical protein